MNDKELTNDTYVKIVDAYLNTGTIIQSSRLDHPLLYWLVAMGMLDTLEMMENVEVMR